jgi:lipoprotein-anchoring transpeptidase ErfK/SrfK
METPPKQHARRSRLWFIAAAAFILTPTLRADELRLEIDLSDRLLTAYNETGPVKTYRVAVGTKEKPTPQGTFAIRKVIWNPRWVPPKEKWAKGKEATPPGHPDNPMKRVKMFFQEPDYYIHGTAAEDSMGDAASHGCIRMTPEEVTELAKMVMENGGKPMPDPWYRRILRRRSTAVVRLEKPIPVRIVP